MKTTKELQETPVYVASAWWRDCEPFVTIVGGSAKVVEATIQAAMLQMATDAYNEQETKERERDDFLLDMARSFATKDTLGKVFPSDVLQSYCRDKLLPHRDLDYENFRSLVNGDPNAVVHFFLSVAREHL